MEVAKRILMDHLGLKTNLGRNQDYIEIMEKAFEHLKINRVNEKTK
jgi:hypothetical protein